MAPFQMIVRNLQGQSRCFDLVTPSIKVRELFDVVEDAEGIPSSLTRLVTGTRQLQDEDVLSADEHGMFPSCTLLGRLLGGKGGFGSLLRGSQSQKKTTNFDACRDMNGRRLRHVNSEQKLIEWQEQAKEREMEKKALEQMKKEEKELKQRVEKDTTLAHLREQTEDILDKVVDAVKDATSSKAFGKRKVEELEPEAPAKRLRMFGILEEDEEDSEDEDAGLEAANDAGPSGVGSDIGVGPSIGSSKSDQAAEDLPSTAKAEPADRLEPGGTSGAPAEDQQSTGMMSSIEAAREYGRPLDLSKFGAAQELEVLGLDRLKEELQERGLKCGGSLGERAARLFLLKSIPLEKLDKKLFTKPPPGKKGV